ncbi:MAG: UbiA-like protein EboC [Cyclobacteriaceae bacterium]|nr:UbiA-like protein EboC [Cyclobacteriaceae bacterium]
MKKVKAYLQLARPANILTAIADILAGATMAGFMLNWFDGQLMWSNGIEELALLIVSTIGLYGGGVVLNDVFDASLDSVERPERPIPSGRVSLKAAAWFGIVLLLTGIGAAYQVSAISGHIAAGVALCAVLYDYKGKHHPILGPLNMAGCRAGNLLLGISFVPAALSDHWVFGLVPLLYITAITMISRGEVHGGSRKNLILGALMYLAALALLLVIAKDFQYLHSLPFLLLFAGFVFPPIYSAYKNPVGKNVGMAVKAGVIGVILLDAAMVAGFGNMLMGGIVCLLLPLAMWLGKAFAVT